MVKWIAAGREIYRKYKEDEMTVYAAQVSFFCAPVLRTLYYAASYCGPDDTGHFAGGIYGTGRSVYAGGL